MTVYVVLNASKPNCWVAVYLDSWHNKPLGACEWTGNGIEEQIQLSAPVWRVWRALTETANVAQH